MSERFSDYRYERAFLEILRSFTKIVSEKQELNNKLSFKQICTNITLNNKNQSIDYNLLNKTIQKANDKQYLNCEKIKDIKTKKEIKYYSINFNFPDIKKILKKYNVFLKEDILFFHNNKTNKCEKINLNNWLSIINNIITSYEVQLKCKYQQFWRRTQGTGKNRNPISLNVFSGMPLSLIERRVMGLLISSDFITKKRIISSKLDFLKQMQIFYDIELTNQKSSIYEIIDKLVENGYIQFDNNITINNKFFETLKQIFDSVGCEWDIEKVLNMKHQDKIIKELYDDEIKKVYVSTEITNSNADWSNFILNFFLKYI